jgi:hypothetical protein
VAFDINLWNSCSVPFLACFNILLIVPDISWYNCVLLLTS